MMKKKNIVAISLLTVFLFTGCATYYQQSISFQQDFSSGNLTKAQAFLEHHKKASEKKDRLLYFLDRGVVEQMLGNYQESNFYFEEAYLFTQDYRKSFANDLVGMIANPMLKPYKGEDFELVLIHFYKAINYIQLNELDQALVEVRRININLNELNDKYEKRKNRYKEDAFAHNLMGIIYEAKEDYNNAFIAYRNSLEVYKDLYSTEFNVQVPEQLKVDLLRMAAYNGFRDELKRYEEEFGFQHKNRLEHSGDVVFFWLNGLGPVKSEFSLNLSTIDGEGGILTFANEDEGFSIPYTDSDYYYDTEPTEFSDLKFVRMAIPKYKVRRPLLDRAILKIDSFAVPLQKVEDVSSIALSTLQDRMLREITKSVGRVALKQAAEAAARSENEDLGTVLSIVNAFTEKADTRNWQTLPHSIYYQRVNLPADTHRIQLITDGPNLASDTLNFKVDLKKDETIFRTYHSLESSMPIEQ